MVNLVITDSIYHWLFKMLDGLVLRKSYDSVQTFFHLCRHYIQIIAVL